MNVSIKIIFSIIGKYKTWVHDDTDNHNPEYCAFIPFTYAFISLIFHWCFLPSMVFCVSLASFLAHCLSVESDENRVSTFSNIYSSN